jgi:hypothetical protein
MDNNDIEQLIALIGEQFYEHIEEKYGKSVVKILRYHDIDSYTILNQVSKQELIDLFEKPDDENSTNELMNLKKDICNISQDSISMKVGTKNKLILLLKLTQDIVKKKRFQLVSEARLKRLDQYRSTSSSSTNNNDSDIENNFGKYHESVEESIGKLLIKLNKNIHGITNTNVSVNNFKISVEHTNNLLVPICSVQCICGDRVKLYFKHNQFQLSNFIKHIKTINNKRAFIINDGSEELDDPQVSYQMDFDNQVSKNENNRSINHNSSGTSIRIDTGDSDTLTPTTLKKT